MIHHKKKVLILLATYNGESYIEEQIDSILSQKDVDIEILISDDNSSDKTLELIKRNYSFNKNINLIHHNNNLMSHSANFFFLIQKTEIANFDYIAFADQDDIWFEDKIINSINQIEEANCDGFSSDVIAYWPNANKKIIIKKSQQLQKYDHWFESPGPGCSQIFTKNSFLFLQNFVIKNSKNLAFVEYDWFIYTFYRYHKFKWIISKEPKILYRQHENNTIGANIGLASKFFRIKNIYNKWYKNQVVNKYIIITNNNFKDFINHEKLILKPFNLRRKKLESLFIWFILVFKYFD